MTGPCSITRLEAALAGNLPANDESSLHLHLEECEKCSTALERMAGGTEWCEEAASLLIKDELDPTLSACEEWSEVDFTVEHLAPSDEPNMLGRLGGYDILEVIGHGGMGVVLKGFDRQLKRCVAIKMLAPRLAHSPLAKKRFTREAQAAAAVVHPHVLAIHHVQADGPLPYLVMPLMVGNSLAQRLARQGTLELKEILRIGMQAAAGLAAAHEQGLVHRDVKPANILLDSGVERAVLTDFGLARAADDDVAITRWGIVAGTPQYMSPEQARGEPLDGRSDLFSFGCVLYEMATGISPFRTNSAMATMRRLVEDSPQAIASLNPELPPWFIAIVDRLLEKVPSRRFSSAKEVSELLEGCLAHVQQPTSVPLPSALCAVRPHLGSRLVAIVAMLAILGGGFLAMLLFASANSPDIAGLWFGENWGKVVLKLTMDGEYTGSYSDTIGEEPGEIRVKWSRIERRFNGTWREGEDRFGELSLRLIDNEIRGALTTDPKSKINPATPRLADLSWIKADAGLQEEDMTRSEGKDRRTSKVRHFVRMVVAPDSLTFQGRPTTWDELPKMLEAVANRRNTVLEFAISSENLTLAEVNSLHSRAQALSHQFGFEYISNVGVQPVGSKGSAPSARTDQPAASSRIVPDVLEPLAPSGVSGHDNGMMSKLLFDPVVERLLNSDGIKAYFDLETGQAIFPPKSEMTDEELRPWILKSGIDFQIEPTVAPDGSARMTTFGFNVLRVADARWDDTTPMEVKETLAEVKRNEKKGAVVVGNGVYLFQTREGRMGILRLTDISDNPPNIGIRYKLAPAAKAGPSL